MTRMIDEKGLDDILNELVALRNRTDDLIAQHAYGYMYGLLESAVDAGLFPKSVLDEVKKTYDIKRSAITVDFEEVPTDEET